MEDKIKFYLVPVSNSSDKRSPKRLNVRGLKVYHKTVGDDSTTRAPADPEKKQRRSFLQAPKTYSKGYAAEVKTDPIPIPQQAKEKVPSPEVETQEYFIGDRICISGVKTGTLLFFGTTHIASGLWCGIALDEPDGIHDGLVNGVRYFTCRKGHGIFAPVDRVAHIEAKKPQLLINEASKPPPKVEKVTSQPVCKTDILDEECLFQERPEYFEERSDSEERDYCSESSEDISLEQGDFALQGEGKGSESTRRRQLPRLPRPSAGISKLYVAKREYKMAESEMDGQLKMIMEDADEEERVEVNEGLEEKEMADQEAMNKTFNLLDEQYMSPETKSLGGSLGGSSGGGEDSSWSLGGKPCMTGDGKQYLNITFDGENSDSKRSAPEVAEEQQSSSPEFIFDQEMTEDGDLEEFTSTNVVEMSRESSLGLLSSLMLDKTDLLLGYLDEEEQFQKLSEEGATESLSETDSPKKSKLDTSVNTTVNSTVDFESIEASTPVFKKQTGPNLNTTYTQDEPAMVDGKDSNQNLNATFTLESKETVVSDNLVPVEVLSLKSEFPTKGAMVDSGISMRSSMTESTSSIQSSMIDSEISMKASMVESTSSVKGGLMDSGIASVKSGMLDSGISLKGSMVDSGFSTKDKEGSESTNEKFVNRNSQDMDDIKLQKDLQAGHSNKERPISFLSTTSGDTGYVPDTDSELGTLTLNSPQDWTDRGFHGNSEQNEVTNIHDVEEYEPGEVGSHHVPVEIDSDICSDIGTVLVDTDTEAESLALYPVQPGESTLSGVDLVEESDGDLSIIQTSSDENKDLNVAVSVRGAEVTESVEQMEDERVEADQVQNSTFTLSAADVSVDQADGDQLDSGKPVSEGGGRQVTIVIEDKPGASEVKTESMKKVDNVDKVDKAKDSNKLASPKKKKVLPNVSEFKKPNINVTSRLADYIKAPLPVKPKEDKANTEEAKNKRNSMKSKVESKKVIESKIGRVTVDKNESFEKKRDIIEKEPVKKVKRTPPKSKWDSIMSQIEAKKDDEKSKPKTEVKSKLAELLHTSSPVPPAKKEGETTNDEQKEHKETKEVKEKRKIVTSRIPDYSKVQSKLKITAPPTPPRLKKDEGSPSVDKDRGRKSSRDAKLDKVRHLSGDSVKSDKSHSLDSPRRPTDKPRRHSEIRNNALHIDLAESIGESGSVVSSARSSHTDLSTTGADDESSSKLRPKCKFSGVERALSHTTTERSERGSTSAISEISESSQVLSKEEKSASEPKRKRKSGLLPPTNSVEKGVNKARCARKVQFSGQSAANKAAHGTKSPLITNQAAKEEPEKDKLTTPSKKPTNQNRNKTSKTKTSSKSSTKSTDFVPNEVHSREVQRLEALCESRTKQLNMIKLQLQSSNQAFDAMTVLVNYLSHDLDAFSCPHLLEQVKCLQQDTSQYKQQIESLEAERKHTEADIEELKKKQEEELCRVKQEGEDILNTQRETLVLTHEQDSKAVEDKHKVEVEKLKLEHETKVTELKKEHSSQVERLTGQHRDDITVLQTKHENQMEELHKQHQDKLEDITNRFESIKMTLSEKVETLRSECDRLRDHAKVCEDALQRDSDYKVQMALAPFRQLPAEIESLKHVIEMRNEEIQKLRTHNLELQKKLEELPVAQEKIIGLQQKLENTEAIINIKSDHEKQLNDKCQNLMRKFDKESRANKRLSMDYEELMWKIQNSPETGSEENLFFKKLNQTPGSPDLVRLRTPSGGGGRSPVHRRATHSVGDNSEKKIKRRSATFLVEKDKERATSPLACSTSSLTRSWSPSTELEQRSASAGPLSQSWTEGDVFESSENMGDRVRQIEEKGSDKTPDVVRSAPDVVKSAPSHVTDHVTSRIPMRTQESERNISSRRRLIVDDDDKERNTTDSSSESVLSQRLHVNVHSGKTTEVNGTTADHSTGSSFNTPINTLQNNDSVNQSPKKTTPSTNRTVAIVEESPTVPLAHTPEKSADQKTTSPQNSVSSPRTRSLRESAV